MPDAIYLRKISCIGVDVQYIVIGLPSANLMEAMLTQEYVEESNRDQLQSVVSKFNDIEKALNIVMDDLTGKKNLNNEEKAFIGELLAEPGNAYASLSAREAALLDNYRHIVDEEDKGAVERTALMAARASQGETQSGTKKKTG